jgi:hypothetical protein
MMRIWMRLLPALASLALALPALAAPLAVFDCREITGRDWPRTLVTYPVAFPPGQVKVGKVKLVDAAGVEQPCQFSRVETFKDGSVKAGRLSFYAELPKGGSYHYELQTGKPAKLTAPPTAKTRRGLLTLDNGITALRLPAGKSTYKTPLRFAKDHTEAAAAGFDTLAKAGLAFGPIAGIRLADGAWVGGSYFAYEPIEVVRQRQGYLKDMPADAWARAAQAVPTVTGYETVVVEAGPLFTEARVRFAFSNGGYYQLTARLLANDPAARIDEIMDAKGNCPGDDPLYVAMALNGKVWKPDALFAYARGNSNKSAALQAVLEKQGVKPENASYALAFDQPDTTVTALVPHDPWSDRAQYFGLVDSKGLAASKAAPFLAIVPQHAGSWRGAHWVFPPKTPHLFQEIHAYADGLLEMRWTIRNQPHSQNVLHTGEFDPDFGLTGMRRLWCLVGGPFQYHNTLSPLRAYEGFVNLDAYAHWTLAWDEQTREGVTLPPPAKPDQTEGPLKEFVIAMGGGGDIGPWFSHFRQAERMGWPKAILDRLADPAVPAAQKGHLKAQVAALCSLLADSDFNTRASMTHQGNPNMPINRFFALPFTAVAIPDHPLAKQWQQTTAAYVAFKGGTNISPGGAWSELISYYPASAPTLVHGALVADQAGLLSEGTRTLVTGPVDYALGLLSPPDPRFGARLVPGFGHEGNMLFNLWTPAAALLEKTDPQRAALYAWAWGQQGKPGDWQHTNGFGKPNEDRGALADGATPALLRRGLASVNFPGFGAVLRAHPGDPNETYFGFRQGYMASHSDSNQGDFVLYAKGAPLTTTSLFGYPLHQIADYMKLNTEFGWHSRVRFGDPAQTGGWPGGGPVSGVHRHFFSDSVDYLKALGDYGPVAAGKQEPEEIRQRWTRQVLFLKGKAAAGPNYFVLRDSFTNPAGDAGKLERTWWCQRVLGTKAQVQAEQTGFRFASPFNGVTLQTRFLQPAQVTVVSREATAKGPQYGRQAELWCTAHGQKAATNATAEETITVNAVGPIPAGQDVLVLLYPQGKEEAAPQCQSLANGAAKIITAEGTDYVFASRAGMTFKQGDVAFKGVAGAVRVYPTEVHLIVAEGAGTVRYQGYTLQAGQPATKSIPLAEINKGGTVVVPAPKTTITFALDDKAGAITQLAPGVRKQALATGGVAYAFTAEQPITFTQDGVTFSGTRGGIVTDTKAGTTRLVLLDGEAIGLNGLRAEIGSGPYDLTFTNDKVIGIAEGPARLLYLSMPAGIVQLPGLTIDGITYAPGTYGRTAIVPVFDGRTAFTLGNLPQPPVFRDWVRW